MILPIKRSILFSIEQRELLLRWNVYDREQIHHKIDDVAVEPPARLEFYPHDSIKKKKKKKFGLDLLLKIEGRF